MIGIELTPLQWRRLRIGGICVILTIVGLAMIARLVGKEDVILVTAAIVGVLGLILSGGIYVVYSFKSGKAPMLLITSILILTVCATIGAGIGLLAIDHLMVDYPSR